MFSDCAVDHLGKKSRRAAGAGGSPQYPGKETQGNVNLHMAPVARAAPPPDHLPAHHLLPCCGSHGSTNTASREVCCCWLRARICKRSLSTSLFPILKHIYCPSSYEPLHVCTSSPFRDTDTVTAANPTTIPRYTPVCLLHVDLDLTCDGVGLHLAPRTLFWYIRPCSLKCPYSL